jgi:hypothetical protein
MTQNIVLIVADTLRSRELKNGQGFLDLPTDIKRINNYYSNSPWTIPAHATIFTGELPSEHGVNTENTYFDLENNLTSCFSQNGYRTICLTENPLISAETGFSEGFDKLHLARTFRPRAKSWNEVWEKDNFYSSRIEKYLDFGLNLLKNRDLESLRALLDYLKPSDSSEYNPTESYKTINSALSFLEGKRKTFLFLNLMPTHSPYTFSGEEKKEFLDGLTEEEIKEITQFDTLGDYLDQEINIENIFTKRRSAYKASISYLESLLEYFYMEAPEDTVFIVVGDHGELIGEYKIEGIKLVDHHFGTFKELIDVPLYLFSKGEKTSYEIQEGLHDHKTLYKSLKFLAKEERFKLKGKDMIRSEYFGKAGFNRQFGFDIPEKFSDLFERKSFTIIDDDFKFDVASDGEYLWYRENLSEEEMLEQVPDSLDEIADLFYRWRF